MKLYAPLFLLFHHLLISALSTKIDSTKLLQNHRNELCIHGWLGSPKVFHEIYRSKMGTARWTRRVNQGRSLRERGNGRVNQEIARHTQNSTARWNLNSVSARSWIRFSTGSSVSLHLSATFLRYVPSYFVARFPFHPVHLRAWSPSTPFLRTSCASYSLSFVIRKQTGRRSCQVGGVGDETAVSVCPFFFYRHLPPPAASILHRRAFCPSTTWLVVIAVRTIQIQSASETCKNGNDTIRYMYIFAVEVARSRNVSRLASSFSLFPTGAPLSRVFRESTPPTRKFVSSTNGGRWFLSSEEPAPSRAHVFPATNSRKVVETSVFRSRWNITRLSFPLAPGGIY